MGEIPSLIMIGFIISGRVEAKHDFSTVRCGTLLFLRALQGHTGGYLIAPELMGHAPVPFKWKQFLFHRGRSFNLRSIFEAGLTAG